MDVNDMDDAAYAAAMERLAELKQKPIDMLTEDEKKEKLRLANRESARKMRRKQADSLVAAEKDVERLEAELNDYMTKLAEGWYKFKEIKAENDLLRGELQTLQSLQDTQSATGNEQASHPAGATQTASNPTTIDGHQPHQPQPAQTNTNLNQATHTKSPLVAFHAQASPPYPAPQQHAAPAQPKTEAHSSPHAQNTAQAPAQGSFQQDYSHHYSSASPVIFTPAHQQQPHYTSHAPVPEAPRFHEPLAEYPTPTQSTLPKQQPAMFPSISASEISAAEEAVRPLQHQQATLSAAVPSCGPVAATSAAHEAAPATEAPCTGASTLIPADPGHESPAVAQASGAGVGCGEGVQAKGQTPVDAAGEETETILATAEAVEVQNGEVKSFALKMEEGEGAARREGMM